MTPHDPSPSAQKDIVGTVKDLQQDILDIGKMPGTAANAMKQARLDVWLEQSGRAFPRLAQALLIAVEALEEVERQQKEGSGNGTVSYWYCNQCGGNKPLEGVLSRIRSL